MGLPFMARDDGTPAITWDAVNARLAGKAPAPAEPQMNLQRFRRAG
jgi:hypothetical protein